MPQILSEIRPAERPRERLRSLGPTALTVVELLAILLGTGTARRDVLEVAANLIASTGGSLRALARRPLGALAAVSGVGEAKAARVIAALALAQRTAAEAGEPDRTVRTPADVFRWCGPALRDLPVEEFHLLAMDTQNRITRELLITRGILNSSLVHPREVFRAAIAEAAAGVIVLHNHPSGNPAPSADDRRVTRQLVEAGRLLDIPVYDQDGTAQTSRFLRSSGCFCEHTSLSISRIRIRSARDFARDLTRSRRRLAVAGV